MQPHDGSPLDNAEWREILLGKDPKLDDLPGVPIQQRARSQVTLVELAGGHMVAIIVNARDDARLDAFVKETAPILESFAFAPS